MAEKGEAAMGKLAAVLIPVAVGSLLGLFTSISTSYVNFQFQQKETLKKERNAALERAMTLTLKYSSDVGRALGVGIITKGEVTPKELGALLAPTDTLTELNAVIRLHFPKLKGEVDQIYRAHGVMMQRFDEIIDAREKHRGEDAAAFTQRMQKETAVATESVRNLTEKLSAMAQ